MFMQITSKSLVNLDKLVSITQKGATINLYYTNNYTGVVTFDSVKEAEQELEEIEAYLMLIGELS